MNFITIKNFTLKGEEQYAFECTYCRWNSMKVGLSYPTFDKTFKSCRIKYKISVENRGREISNPGKYIKSVLEKSLRKNNIDRQMSSLGENSRMKRFGKYKEWDKKQLHGAVKKFFKIDEFEKQQKSVVKRITVGGNQPIEPSLDEFIDTRMSDSDSSSDGDDPTTSEKKMKLQEEQKEKISLFSVSDFAKMLAGSLKENKSKEDDILDDYLNNFREQDWKLRVFEKTPIKLFEGDESLFPLVSEMQAIITKKCPETGESIMSYESFAKSFKHKYSAMFLEYSPQIKLYKVYKAGEDQESIAYQFSAYNLTKNTLELSFEIDHEASKGGRYKFAEDKEKLDYVLYKRSAAQSSEEKKYRERFEIFYNEEEANEDEEENGMREVHLKANLKITGTVQSYEFNTVYVLQLGDEEIEKSLLERYKIQYRYRNY